MSEWRGERCLTFEGKLDPIATIFYVLTRYEEYGAKKVDEHGRFRFEDSVTKDWIEYAVCDRLAHALLESLNLNPARSTVKIRPTFDIDNTFAFKHKTGSQRRNAILKDWALFRFKRIKARRIVDKGGVDPHDTFDLIEEIAKSHETNVFWLVGDLAAYDRNLSLQVPEHADLIKRMAEVAEVGLHPSYASHLHKEIVDQEKNRIEQVTGSKVVASRQHFLRFSVPETFRNHIGIGLKSEYSMGYAEHVGFRAGTARKHKWFDVENNSITEYEIVPFVYMDGTLMEYMKLSTKESQDSIDSLFNEVNNFGGNFVFIWHNETIGDYADWKGWSRVLEHTLNLNNA